MLVHTPFKFANGIITKNRFALAPMTTSQSLINGQMSVDDFLWYKQCVLGGFGIIITCAAHISLDGQGWKNELGIFDDHLIPTLKILSNFIKFHHALSIVQIYHGGLRSPKHIIAQEPIDLNIITTQKIEHLVETFGNAAARAEQAGFSGVEIHGANGYLITQFISTKTNHRTDQYGGSLENRARFLLEVLKNCRKKVSKSFIVGVRLSPENMNGQKGLNLEENIIIAKWLEDHGADYLHLATVDARKQNLLPKFRDNLKEFPILIAGGIQFPHECLNTLNMGADIVALGKIAIGNPFLPIKTKNVDYLPNMMPFTREYLKNCEISQNFLEILKNFQNFLS